MGGGGWGVGLSLKEGAEGLAVLNSNYGSGLLPLSDPALSEWSLLSYLLKISVQATVQNSLEALEDILSAMQ